MNRARQASHETPAQSLAKHLPDAAVATDPEIQRIDREIAELNKTHAAACETASAFEDTVRALAARVAAAKIEVAQIEGRLPAASAGALLAGPGPASDALAEVEGRLAGLQRFLQRYDLALDELHRREKAARQPVMTIAANLGRLAELRGDAVRKAKLEVARSRA